MVPLYPHSSFNFWTRQNSSLLFLDSARSALYLIAKKFKDHLFLIPSYTCPSVFSTLSQAGVDYSFVDINSSLDFDSADLDYMMQENSDRSIALVSTSLMGARIRDYKKLLNDIIIVEDRAQGLYDPTSMADFQMMSFGKGKMISGFGGGALIDRNGILRDDIAKLQIKKDFTRSYMMSIAQKIISRIWFLIEGGKFDPEMVERQEVNNIVPMQINKTKQNWILKGMNSCDLAKRASISNYYADHINRKYLFDIKKDVSCLRFPIKKSISYSGVSKMRDYHETYHLACQKRGQEMKGARMLVDGCFLPSHDLVSMEYAKRVVEVVNT